MRFSVIMPVYNAGRTIEQSLRSIAAQSFRDFELVVVDDGSTDGSMEIVESYADKTNCRIVRKERNGGVAAARNLGLESAKGDYVCFVDADDILEENALSVLEAIDSDIIGWDWTLGFGKNGRYMRQRDYSSPLEALRNLCGGTMRWNLWLFCFRRSFIQDNSIRFIPGADMGEDMMFTLTSFGLSSTVTQVHRSLYRYNALSETSLSRSFSSERRAQIDMNLSRALGNLEGKVPQEWGNYLKLFIKLPLLISGERKNYELWTNWMPEANGYATLNRDLPARTRWLQKMASKGNWTAVKLYYKVVYRFVYGVIFR